MTDDPHSKFQSPFSWRYGSDEMRVLWSERHKRVLWRKLWIALARAEQSVGLVSAEQVDDLISQGEAVDMARALSIEAEIHHDLMAEVRTYAEQCPVGGGIIHLGATSADIEDNADVLRIRDSLHLIEQRLAQLLLALCEQIAALKDVAVIAFTHLQPAEPTTMGYRLALYMQDLWADYQALTQMQSRLMGKGFRGAVGTGASYTDLLAGTPLTAGGLSQRILDEFNLKAFPVVGQTYPRRQDWEVMTTLSGIAMSLYRFAFDLRLLQSPLAGEWGEPFASAQVGSSAMPFKRNPINAEKIDSLARLVESLVSTAWGNSAHSLLERTLDDSANRREFLPVALLAVDEMLSVATRLVRNLRVDQEAAQRNLERYGLFAATERILMATARAGADRQAMHEHLREHSLAAWHAVARGEANPLAALLMDSAFIQQYLTREQIAALMDVTQYTGDAASRAEQLASHIETHFRS